MPVERTPTKEKDMADDSADFAGFPEQDLQKERLLRTITRLVTLSMLRPRRESNPFRVNETKSSTKCFGFRNLSFEHLDYRNWKVHYVISKLLTLNSLDSIAKSSLSSRMKPWPTKRMRTYGSRPSTM